MNTIYICDEEIGLSKLVDRINFLTPQYHSELRSENNKIWVLRSAFPDCEWVQTPVSNIITAEYAYNVFLTALHEQLQLYTAHRNLDANKGYSSTHFTLFGPKSFWEETDPNWKEPGRPRWKEDAVQQMWFPTSSFPILENAKLPKDLAHRQLACGLSAVDLVH